MKNRNIHAKSLVCAVAVLALCSGVYVYWQSLTPYFMETLAHYGYSQLAQQHAIQHIFQVSTVIQPHQTLATAFPNRFSKKQLLADLIVVVQETQKKLVRRVDIKGSWKERWETNTQEWMNDPALLGDLQTLGFIDAVVPTKNKTDAVCVLGSTAPNMAKRINYVQTLLEAGLETDKVILLTGERYASDRIDGTEEELTAIAKNNNKPDWHNLTEFDLMREQYQRSALSQRNDIKVYFIDTPKRDLPRANTQTTIVQLIDWLKEHKEVKRVTFVSTQPHVQYQKAIIDIIIKSQKISLDYEVVGSAENKDISQKIISGLEGLGGFLFSATPHVLTAMDIPISDPSQQDALEALYPQKSVPLLHAEMHKLVR